MTNNQRLFLATLALVGLLVIMMTMIGPWRTAIGFSIAMIWSVAVTPLRGVR